MFIACLSGISAFVAIGLEHCIANMVFVPLGVITGERLVGLSVAALPAAFARTQRAGGGGAAARRRCPVCLPLSLLCWALARRDLACVLPQQPAWLSQPACGLTRRPAGHPTNTALQACRASRGAPSSSTTCCL